MNQRARERFDRLQADPNRTPRQEQLKNHMLRMDELEAYHDERERVWRAPFGVRCTGTWRADMAHAVALRRGGDGCQGMPAEGRWFPGAAAATPMGSVSV